MSKYLYLLYLLLSFQLFAQEVKQVLYVAPVRGDIRNINRASKALTSKMREKVGRMRLYTLVNPSESEDIKVIKNYNQSCTSMQECARKEGQAVDAEFVLMSEVLSIGGGARCRITMRMENIFKNETINNTNIDSSCDYFDLEDKFMKAVSEIFSSQRSSAKGERDAFITSSPPGATVIINNEVYGVTPLKTRVPYGEITVQLEISDSSGFRPLLLTEIVEKKKEVWKYHKNLAARVAYLVPNGKPFNYRIFMGKKQINKKKFTNIPLPINKTLQLKVDAPKYESVTYEVGPLDADQKFKLDFELKPKPCLVEIKTKPSGADVFMNGEEVGTTPFRKELKSLNQYKFHLRKIKYKHQQFDIDCTPAKKITKVKNLVVAKNGYLELIVKDQDGKKLYGVDVYEGIRKRGSSGSMIELEAGNKHYLTISKGSDYSRVQMELDLEAGEVVRKEIELNDLYAKMNLDIKQVSGKFSKYDVYHNGRKVGDHNTGNLEIRMKAEEDSTIEIRTDGKSSSETFTVNPSYGERIDKEVQLKNFIKLSFKLGMSVFGDNAKVLTSPSDNTLGESMPASVEFGFGWRFHEFFYPEVLIATSGSSSETDTYAEKDESVSELSFYLPFCYSKFCIYYELGNIDATGVYQDFDEYFYYEQKFSGYGVEYMSNGKEGKGMYIKLGVRNYADPTGIRNENDSRALPTLEGKLSYHFAIGFLYRPF